AAFRIGWVATVAAVVLLLLWPWQRRTPPSAGRTHATEIPPSDAAPGPRLFEDLGVLVVMAGSTLAAMFIHLADTDDPYYVNRSVWVAEHGNAALRDTMFSPEVYNSPYGGGIPIASVEALIGVIAHMSGIRVGTVTYILASAGAAALAVWAMWRLARVWAPRRVFLVFLGSIAFLMLSGDSMLGNFWIVRIWQGKVMAVAILMPLIWAYLTVVHEAGPGPRRRWNVWLLLMAGIAFFGLTPTAAVWGPVMMGAALVAAFLLRSKALAVGAVAMGIGPIVSGLVVALFSSEVGGEAPVVLPAYESFVRILGETAPMVAICLVVLALSPLLPRRGAAATLAGCSALASVLIFAPGILPLVNTVTGSGPILWRMLYCTPIAMLVGLLLGLPRPDLRGVLAGRLAPIARLAPAVPVAAVVLVVATFAVGGRPIWSHTGHGGPVTVSSSPEWKLDVEALEDVRLLDETDVSGVVLLPPRQMKVLTMYTTDMFPVVPRKWFIGNIEEPRAQKRARRVLYALASAEGRVPKQKLVTRALESLDVTLACTWPSPTIKKVMARLGNAGYTRQMTIGALRCASRGTTG
ncbi:MAG: DUF6077 domain-containing protein, partial [Nocardioides sp.]|nr:DUF6077 domain-containing protein [Nocardioides sp.]